MKENFNGADNPLSSMFDQLKNIIPKMTSSIPDPLAFIDLKEGPVFIRNFEDVIKDGDNFLVEKKNGTKMLVKSISMEEFLVKLDKLRE